MDSLDIRLLRAMFRGGQFDLRGIDPQLTLQELARRTEVSRITVRRRLRSWREDGFWRRVTVYPNPDLLGSVLQMQAIIFDPGRNHSQLERKVGETLEPAFMFHVQDFCCPILLSEAPGKAARRQQSLEGRPGVHVLCAPIDIEFPESSLSLSPRDWHALQALRRSPEPDWASVASAVGVTVRGLERRVRRLMDSNSIFFFPELDFRRSPGTVAWIGVLLGEGVSHPRVREEMVRRHPDLLFIDNIFPIQLFLPPEIRKQVAYAFPLLLPVTSASNAEQLRRDIAVVPGVVDVLVGFPTHNTSWPAAWDLRIEKASQVDRLRSRSVPHPRSGKARAPLAA
jgi:DNA-binding Lrp family transcriptional regulator